MAEQKGLEPSASGVTGRRYNRLNYCSVEYSLPRADWCLHHFSGRCQLLSVTGTPKGSLGQWQEAGWTWAYKWHTPETAVGANAKLSTTEGKHAFG